MATGFETAFVLPAYQDVSLIKRKAEAQGFAIYGKGGTNLGDHWSTGPRTLKSFCTRNFPNRSVGFSTAPCPCTNTQGSTRTRSVFVSRAVRRHGATSGAR